MAKKGNGSRRWSTIKTAVAFLVIGVVAGPIVTTVTGLQVSRSTLDRRMHATIIDQKSNYCVGRITEGEARYQGLTYSDRLDLARKYAVMPGAKEADYEVVTECSNKLARIQ